MGASGTRLARSKEPTAWQALQGQRGCRMRSSASVAAQAQATAAAGASWGVIRALHDVWIIHDVLQETQVGCEAEHCGRPERDKHGYAGLGPGPALSD